MAATLVFHGGTVVEWPESRSTVCNIYGDGWYEALAKINLTADQSFRHSTIKDYKAKMFQSKVGWG
jgi:hypothetical protein